MNRTLYDIAQLLESADGADTRVKRVLGLLRKLVPYEQCAVLEARFGFEPHVVALPETAPGEQALLTKTLLGLFGQFVDGKAVGELTSPPQGVHLAVPLVGLDRVIGLVFVRASQGEYTDEHLRWLSVVAAKLAAYYTTLRAHDELAERARERDEARHAAEAANRAKDEFLALVSHALKTPLTSILAWAHVLGDSTADDAARARASAELVRNVQVQAKLIDDILDLSCIASAKLRLNLRMVEPAALIKATVDGLRLEAERKSIRLESELDPESMPLVVDPDRIGQVLSILVSNAIKFTPAGGHIEVSLEGTSSHVRIRVSDSGRGITSETLPHVFDRFQKRAAAGADPDAGLGMGLAIARDLVELHGGRLLAESAGPELGATLTAELPRAAEARMQSALPAGERDSRPLAGVRVLLVDHDFELRESFKAALASHGAEVKTVAFAAEALSELESSRPDVLLFGDLAMPGENVYDLLRDVMARTSPLPVACISSWREGELERERVAGVRLHLAKPLEIRTLVEAVAELAGRTRSSAPLPSP